MKYKIMVLVIRKKLNDIYFYTFKVTFFCKITFLVENL